MLTISQQYYAKLLREATDSASNMSLGQLAAMRSNGQQPTAFGKLTVDYGATGVALGDMNLAEAVAKEYDVLAELLKDELTVTRSYLRD